MAKKVLSLTDVAVKNAKPGPKSFKLSDGGRSVLGGSTHGWQILAHEVPDNGQEKRMVFGLWPDVSLKQARQRRDEARSVAQGIDPGEMRKQDRAATKVQAAEDANTFEVVARDWHTKQVKAWSESHAVRVLG